MNGSLRGLGVVLVVVGTAAGVDAAGGGLALLAEVGRRAEWFLLGVAVVLVAARLRSYRWLVGPAALVVAAVVVHVIRNDLWRTEAPVLGIIVAATGAVLALGPSAGVQRDDLDPTMSATAVGLPRTLRFPPDAPAPDHLAVRAIAARVVVDLRRAARPSRPMRLDVTCLVGGEVALRLPPTWPVVAGRLVGHSIGVAGTLDSEKIFDDPTDDAQGKALRKLAHRRCEDQGRPFDERGVTIVVNVLALIGTVSLMDR